MTLESIADFLARTARERQDRDAAAARIVINTTEAQPDQVAGDLSLANDWAKTTGKPVPPLPLVSEYRPMFQQQIEDKRNSTILADAPKLSEWLKNPQNAAVARDDLSALSWWDQWGRVKQSFRMGEATAITQGQEFTRDIGTALERSPLGRGLDALGETFDQAVLSNDDGTPNLLGRLANWARGQGMAEDGMPRQMVGGPDVTPEQRADAIAATDLGPLYQGAAALLKQMEASGFSPMSYKDVRGVGSALSFVAENLAMSLPQMAAAMTSGQFSPLIQVITLGGEANAELKERTDLSVDQRVAVATGAGTVMAALDYFGLSRVFGGLGAGKVATEAIEGTLVKRLVQNGVTEAAGRTLQAAIAEGTTEALQEAVVMGVTALSGGAYQAGEVIDRFLQAFTAGAASGGALRAGGEAVTGVGAAAQRLTEGDGKARTAAETQAQIAEIANQAAQSKLRTRMPDVFRAWVERATEGGSKENLYVPADKFVGYFQGAGIDPFALADEMDGVSREDLETALATGGDLRIPTATYAAKLAGSEADAFFMENMRFDPDEFTSAEARAFEETKAELMAEAMAEAERTFQEQQDARTFEAEIYDTMVERLRMAGRATDVATTEAMLYPAFYRVMAERSGLTTQEFLQRYPLPQVRGDMPQGIQARNIDDLTITLATARAARQAGVNQAQTPLLEWIASRGGIDDVGGELAARNAVEIKRGRGRKTLRLARALDAEGRPVISPEETASGKRFGWDDVAQAAVEAGFLANDPRVLEWQAAMRDGTVAPDLIPALMDAIDAELRGDAQLTMDEMNAGPTDEAMLDDLERYLAEIGTSLDDDDATIRAAIERDQAERGRSYGQTASVRRGRETLKSFGLDPDQRYTTREVAAALEARQRKKYGTIERGDYSDEASKRIANWMVEETLFEVEQAEANPMRSAVGWYSTKFQSALDALGAAFPEFTGNMDPALPGVALLGNRQNARDFFTALMAITSDGAKVADNFRFAAGAYETFRQTGRIDADVTFGGERNTSMRINLQNIQDMLDAVGPDRLSETLLRKDTISNLKKIAKAEGRTFSSDYKASMELPYSALVFGPKLGAFYANLMGDTGYLTMDRWWSRTFNRYRGTLLQQPTEAGLARFKELVTADQRRNTPAAEMTDDEALALTVDYVRSYKAKNYKNGTEIEKAANTLYKAAFEGLEDQPFNASDREFMINTTIRAQKALKRRGIDLTIADIQAVLWYYEKRLYGELGARQTQDISYEEIARNVVAGRDNPDGPADPVDGAAGDETFLDQGSDREAESGDGPALDVVDGEFDASVGRTYGQAPALPDQPLYVVHNLSAEKLRKAAELGGLAAPSLAVARGDIGFDGFGEISLIGDPSLADPKSKGVRLFNADIYSPRQPRARFKVDAKAARALDAAIGPVADKLGLEFDGIDLGDIERDGLSAVQGQTAVKAAWLDAIGEDVPVVREAPEEPMPVNGFGSITSTDAAVLVNDPAFLARLQRKYDLAIKKNEGNDDLIARINSAWLDEAGNIRADMIAKWADQVAKANRDIEAFRAKPQGQGKISRYLTAKAIDEQIGDRIAQFNGWVRENFGGVTTAMFFETSAGRKQDYTIQNLVREMTRSLRNGENWNYGAGNVRAAVAPEFTSLSEVKAARGQITSEKAMEALKDEINTELFALADKFAPYAGTEGKSWGWGDTFSEFLRDVAKGPRAVAEWPWSGAVPAELMEEAVGFLEKLKGLPTNYFEIKMQRAVGFDEFTAALVPSNLPSDARQILTDAGLDLIEYQRGDDAGAARRAALAEIGPRVFFQENRGSIAFPSAGVGNGDTVVNLFRRADLSTFLHESGHYFLTVMQDLAARGEPGAVQEFETVKSWWRSNAEAVAKDAMRVMPDVTVTADDVILAIDSGTTGDIMKDAAIDVGMQEQFARGFEQYLMEGKAPSIELRTAFEKFRAWLISIYRRLTRLNVEVSEDLRGVFDRMLATDDEIAKARASSGDDGAVFKTAADAGMSLEDWDRYQKIVGEARDEAAAKVLAEAMAPVRRAAEAAYKAERETVRAEVERQQRRLPVYRATQELRFGKTFEGDDAPVKLSRAAIEKDYGTGYLRFLPGVTKDGKGHRTAVFSHMGGMHPDIVAGMYGFTNGRDLLDALTNTPPIAEAIEAETDRIMFERHGDPLKDGTIEATALEAVHGDKRARVLALELSALNKRGGNGTPSRPQQFREIARRTLSAMKVKDAASSTRFLTAERKAGADAYRAVANGDIAAAADAKRRQLLNHMLYAESRKVAVEVEQILDKAAKLGRSDKKLSASIDIDHAKAARAIAAKFGMVRPDPAFDFAMWVEQMRADDPVAADAITGAIATYTQDARDYRKLTVAEIGAVSDAIDSVMAAGKRLKTLEIDGKKVDREAAKLELMTVIEGRSAQANAALSRRLTKLEKAKVGALSILSSLRRMEAWSRDMDDGEQGPFTRYLVRPVMDALDAYRADRTARLDSLLGIINARKEALFGNAIAAPELGYTFENKGELIHAILHTGNESNLEKLLIGRGWSSGLIGQTQATTPTGKLRTDRAGNPIMTRGRVDTSRWDAFVARLISEGTLTKEDYDTAQAIWDLMESTKRPAQAAHKKVFGYYFNEIEATPVVTPFGTYRGGYVPAVADGDASNDGQIRADQAAMEAQATSFMFPTTGSGFTKSRVQNYRTPLALDLMMIPAHMDKVLRFTHLDPVVRQTGSLVNDRELRAAIDGMDKTILPNLVVPWLQRVAQQAVEAQPTTPAGRQAARVWRGLRRRVGLHTMFMNVVNTAQQVTGFSTAMVLVKPALVKSALIRFVKGDAAQMRAEAFQASQFMNDRIRNASRETQVRIQDAITQPTVMGDMKLWLERHGYVMQQAFQNVVDVIVWHAAYDQAIGKGMAEADAVFEADSVIRRSMSAMDPESVSLFESGSAFTRLFTMFYSYFNGQANLVGGEMQTVMRTMGWNGAGRMFWIYVFGIAVPAIVAEMIVQAARGELGDEDDDGYADDLFGLFFGSQARYLAAMIPVAGQLGTAVFNRFNDQFYDDRLSTSPVISVVERSIGAPASIGSAVFGDGDASRAVGDGLTALALILGLPAGWLVKAGGYAVDVAEGDAKPAGAVDLVQGVVTGRDGTAQ